MQRLYSAFPYVWGGVKSALGIVRYFPKFSYIYLRIHANWVTMDKN